MIDWLYSNALGAAVLAVIAAVLIWTFRPSPAVRHALWLVVLVKLVSPTGLWISVPLPVEGPAVEDPSLLEPNFASPSSESEEVPVGEKRTFVFEWIEAEDCEACAGEWVAAGADEEVVPSQTESTAAPAAAESESFDYGPYLIAAWVLGAGYFGWRSVRESLRFSRFARRSVQAPPHLIAEVRAVARRLGVRTPAVRVLTGLSSPLMWCLGRPVLLWPAGLDARLKGDGRLAVIAHELAHLRRRDHWVRRLEMAAVVFHWWNPVFWVARRRLRADAELACDAWAAGQADRRVYAEALLEVCSFNHRRRPAPAVGVSGEGRRAMQERLTMIMRDRVPCRLAFGAKLVVALMAVAAVPAWTLGQQKPTKAEAADPEVQAIEAQMRALTEKLAAVRAAQAAKKSEEAKAAAEAAKAKAAAIKLQLLGEKDVLMEKVAGAPNVKVLTAGEDGVKVIGPDGKELKDVKVIIIDKKAAGQGRADKVPAESGKKIELRLTNPPMKVAPPALEWKLANPEHKPGTKTAPHVFEWKVAPGQGTTTVAPAPGDKLTLKSTVAGEGGHSVTLSRATYKLDKAQAEALGSLLESVKAPVLEVKVDGTTLTLTTTPEVQATVGQIVKLITGQGTSSSTNKIYRVTPGSGVAPLAVPVPPVPPAPPAPPRGPAKPVKPAAQGGVLSLPETEIEVLVVPTGKPVVTPDVKEIQVEVLKHLKDLEKLKDIKGLKELDKLKELKIEVDLEDLKDLKLDAADLKARIEKAIETKRSTEKKPAGPAK